MVCTEDSADISGLRACAGAQVQMTVVKVTKVLVPVTEVLVILFLVEVALMNLAVEREVSVEVVFLLIDVVAD